MLRPILLKDFETFVGDFLAGFEVDPFFLDEINSINLLNCFFPDFKIFFPVLTSELAVSLILFTTFFLF